MKEIPSSIEFAKMISNETIIKNTESLEIYFNKHINKDNIKYRKTDMFLYLQSTIKCLNLIEEKII